MRPNAESIKSAPLKSAREIAAMLEPVPRDERLRIEGMIIWAGVAHGSAERAKDSVQGSA